MNSIPLEMKYSLKLYFLILIPIIFYDPLFFYFSTTFSPIDILADYLLFFLESPQHLWWTHSHFSEIFRPNVYRIFMGDLFSNFCQEIIFISWNNNILLRKISSEIYSFIITWIFRNDLYLLKIYMSWINKTVSFILD